ncbi:hypothetical protein GQX74_003387 [Glossina fuscipes]|nr:hypothetical protein GQX74_003387 [Glossina fuscipes]
MPEMHLIWIKFVTSFFGLGIAVRVMIAETRRSETFRTMVAKPPNKSDRLPNAVKLVRAFNAPGLVKSWASGIAEANELAAAAKGLAKADVVEFELVVFVVLLVLLLVLDCPPAAAVPLAALFASWRFAFCSSTLKNFQRLFFNKVKEGFFCGYRRES